MKMGGGNEELNEEKINLTVAYVGCITSDDNMGNIIYDLRGGLPIIYGGKVFLYGS